MTFELITDEDGRELMEETITKTEQTRKIWTPYHFESKIAELSAEIVELEERRAVLESQLTKFTVKEK